MSVPLGPAEQHESLVAARLGTRSAILVEHVVASRLQHEKAFLKEALLVDLAYATMLDEQGLLGERGAQIRSVLREAHTAGGVQLDEQYDSLALQIEHHIAERLGSDASGRIRTGRSRIDHTAAVLRLAGRERVLHVHAVVTAFVDEVLLLAEVHKGTTMPGWTQGQHSQPWTLGHYLVRHAAVALRNLDRLEQLYARTNLSSLGGSALVGTSWNIDRVRVSDLLGHDAPVMNAHDAGQFTVDWLLEAMATFSIILVELGRMASDLYIWSTAEFGLVRLADGMSGTSSAMPQKRNAIALEFVRGWAGRSTGWWITTVGVVRSATSTDADLPYAGNVLSEAGEMTWRCTDLMRELLRTTTFDINRLASAAAASMGVATELADELVRHTGIAFSAAHRIVAGAVRVAEECGALRLEQWHIESELKRELGDAVALPAGWVAERLDLERFIASRTSAGGAMHADVASQIDRLHHALTHHASWSAAAQSRVSSGLQQLGIDR